MSKWDEKYNTDEYIFGTRPNRFLVECASGLKPGKALSLGEGEGRNAVYLAGLGYEVTAVDLSVYALKKAQRLAQQNGATLTTIHSDLNTYVITPDQWDVILCFFVHILPEERARMHQQVVKGLRPGGVYILEGFSPEQMRFAKRGPDNPGQLYDLAIIRHELDGLEFSIARQVERLVDDAEPEQGMCAVSQIKAFKPD
jgi:SAM-dependent methyltransferase